MDKIYHSSHGKMPVEYVTTQQYQKILDNQLIIIESYPDELPIPEGVVGVRKGRYVVIRND